MESRLADESIVLGKLKTSLSKAVFFNFPKLDLNDTFVVFFISNAAISEKDLANIKSRVRNYTGLIVLRSFADNETALDAHVYWHAVAKSPLIGTSHQVWSKADRHLIGSSLDNLTHSSSKLGENILNL